MKKALKILFIVFLSICLTISTLFVSFIGIKIYISEKKLEAERAKKVTLPQAPEEYKKYVCYDPYLVALQTTDSGWEAYIDKQISDVTGKTAGRYHVIYNAIANEDPSQFLSVKIKKVQMFDPAYKTYVYQNPDNYIDLWNEWEIDRIEIGSAEHVVGGMKEVFSSTADAACISEFREFLFADEEDLHDVSDDLLKQGKFVMEDREFNGIAIKVCFKESESIVWISNIQSFYLKNSGERIICMIKRNGASEILNISEYENLYNWLSESIEAKVSE